MATRGSREIERDRLGRLAELGSQLEPTGRLRTGLSGAEAVDPVRATAGPETYEQLVLDRRWTPERFECWLGAALTDLMLAG